MLHIIKEKGGGEGEEKLLLPPPVHPGTLDVNLLCSGGGQRAVLAGNAAMAVQEGGILRLFLTK